MTKQTYTILRVTVDQEIVEVDGDSEVAARVAAAADPSDGRTMYVREGRSHDEGDWFELARELTDCWLYDPSEFELPPAPDPWELKVVDDELECPHCGSNAINEKLVESKWSEVHVTMTYMVEGQAHYSLDRTNADVQDIEEPAYTCKNCAAELKLPENVTT